MNYSFMPIQEWSDKLTQEGLSKVKQSQLLGLGDDSELHRLLRVAERFMVDEYTNEIWRKRRGNYAQKTNS